MNEYNLVLYFAFTLYWIASLSISHILHYATKLWQKVTMQVVYTGVPPSPLFSRNARKKRRIWPGRRTEKNAF